MILRGSLAGSEDIERFTLEAKAVAKLTHPQIVVIYDVGQCDDQYFYCDGIRRRPKFGRVDSWRPCRESEGGGISSSRSPGRFILLIKMALYIATSSLPTYWSMNNGRARVTDFGLAKHVDRGEHLTLTGQIMGTPAYMSPEQITNRRGEIGPACDVYGLGVLLYELLTGRPPFKGGDQFNTLLQVLDCEPQSPRELNPDVPRELELICLKCLEKDPQRRYASAADLADDLARFLAGDSISAASPKLVDRLVRTLERSQYDREFHTWSRMLLHLAWISLATHVLVFLNRMLRAAASAWRIGGDSHRLKLWRWVSYCGGCEVNWYPPRGAPARQLLSLWLGYMAGSTTLVVIAYLLTPAGTSFDDFLAVSADGRVGQFAVHDAWQQLLGLLLPDRARFSLRWQS